MSRLKLLLSSILVVFAVSAIASSSASATFTDTGVECKEEGIPTVCLLTPLAEAKGTEAITSKIDTGTESLLAVPSLGLHIVCTEANDTGTIVQTNPLVTAASIAKATIDFHGCTILNEPPEELGEKCEVVEGLIKTELIVGSPNATEPQDLTFKAEKGTTFAVVSIKSKTGQTCPALVKGENPVKGEQLCTLEENKVDAETHLMTCLESGSKELKFGSNAATFLLEESIVLASKEPWDLVLA